MFALASMEEIDLDAWNAGRKNQAWVPKATDWLKKSQTSFRTAFESCSLFKEWFPRERREEVTPDIDYFHEMDRSIGQVIATLSRGELPSLAQIHGISAAMREEDVVAERKAVALRGTAGHFPAGHP